MKERDERSRVHMSELIRASVDKPVVIWIVYVILFVIIRHHTQPHQLWCGDRSHCVHQSRRESRLPSCRYRHRHRCRIVWRPDRCLPLSAPRPILSRAAPAAQSTPRTERRKRGPIRESRTCCSTRTRWKSGPSHPWSRASARAWLSGARRRRTASHCWTDRQINTVG